ncbi:uncharacterized protein LOC119740890 [Patiria miniata]|uniref:KASH domain-containing protein n=1 Tax=Patiria miniata TaxID=46514 RepID=A0A914BA18_PATMI|nr:uncharacterized protein LOC119740890 [Patiria miniata]XP_038072286.1 uncharacterized protein LOC119740890 [Patiria miniata]XP_038072287.1 uncharacterized protein LOC119740890 [Patiria miniata]
MSTLSPFILSRPSPKPKRRGGTASPLTKKKRPSPRAAEKMPRPRRKQGVATDTSNRRGGKKRHQREGGNGVPAVAECQEFQGDLNRLISWLTATIDQSEQWKAPSNNTLSLRVQLEKYLTFAMELQTRQHLKDSVLLRGQDLIQLYPQLTSNLQATLELIDRQYQRLEERLDTQFRQLEEALASLETSARSDSKNHRSFDAELIMDSIEQMSFRLQNSKRRNSPMEVSVKTLNKQVDTFNTTNKLSSTGGSDSSCSSSPDFDVLYEELSDWLSELHMAVTDSQKGQSDQRMEQMFKGYTQELHLREVTRAKLNKKANRLLARRQSTSADVTTKLQSINDQWASLQACLEPGTGPNATSSQDLPSFASSEEVMTLTLEVEEVIVQLKGWLTEMERKLFATESIKCPGSVEHMEKRLEAHKELQVDIAKNSEGIQVVLNMCEILQKDRHACASEKERESLQLAAFNLERRWQAIQAQAMALQCSLEEKLRTFKGNSTVFGEDCQSTAASATTVVDNKNIPLPTYKSSLLPYKPSGAKDDSALFTLGEGINYDDILLVREAFSENDAFSMSDASEVSLGDFAFDDVLPMKGEDEDVTLSVPSQTPDIMELSDEMIDAYLKMEEEQLKLEESGIDCDILPEVAEIRGRSNSELEFWSMSPREDLQMSNSVELPHVMHSLVDLDQEPVLLRDRSDLPKSFSAHSSTNYQPITLGKYSTGTVDFMSSVVEDALESLCSDDDEFDEEYEDVHEADDEEDVDVTLTEERCQSRSLDDCNDCNDDDDEAIGNLLFAMEDLDEPDPSPTFALKPAKPLSHSLPLTHRTLPSRDVPTHDYPASYPNQPSPNTWSHPSVTIAKSPHQKRGFFPSHGGCFLPNPFEDVVSSSPVKSKSPVPTNASDELRKLRRRLSQVSNPFSEEETKRQQKMTTPPPQDNLLEITDLSLSHMYESLDLVTELTHSLMPGVHSPRRDVDSPLDFPLLERIEDSDSDSFSDSSEEIEREDLVQIWINENMPTPPEIIPLEMPPELPLAPIFDVDTSIQEIPTQDLPSLPICNLEGVHSPQETSCLPLTPSSQSDPGIDEEQETDGFLESLPVESEASRGHCTDAESVEVADEEVTLIQQEVVNQPHCSAALRECIEPQPVTDSTVSSNAADGSSKSRLEGTRDFSAIEERLRREIMEQPNQKHAYFTYVSKLAESCADDKNLNQILGDFNHQKCYLWSIGGNRGQSKQPTAECQDVPDTVSDNWIDVASQCSDDTDKLLEASSSLVEELERSARLQASSLPEDEIGSWRDVIVLWLDEQSSATKSDDVIDTEHDVTAHSDDLIKSDNGIKNRETQVDTFTPSRQQEDRKFISPLSNRKLDIQNDASFDATDDGIVPDSNPQDTFEESTDCGIVVDGKQWSSPSELIDSGHFSADGTLDEESLLCDVQDPSLNSVHLTSTPKASSTDEEDETRSKVTSSLSATHTHLNDAPSGHPFTTSKPVFVSPHQQPSYISRVLCLGLPICIFLFFCVLLILLLPAVIVSATGDCSLSLTDNILLHSPSWEPILYYVRGPPPQ